MPSSSSTELAPLVSREQVGNAIGAALRLSVGRGRRYSVKQLSNGTGVKDRVIECALIDPANYDYRPLPLDALFSIMLFLGHDFVNEFAPLAGFLAVDPDAITHDDLAANCIGFVAEHSKARHPASEAGVEISPNEAKALDSIRARIVA